MRFAPNITWDPKVSNYLEHAFGAAKLQQISKSLCTPSLRTCLRVNTNKVIPQVVVQQLKQLFPGVQPYQHPVVSTAVILPGQGPLEPDYQQCAGREVVINRHAGESVLKGANVFAPGLLAASPGIAAGDLVAVSVALEQPGRTWCGVNRGMSLTQDLQQQLHNHEQLYLGVGRATAGRRGLFRATEGLAVEMVQRVYNIPPCNGVLRGQVMLQALPSILAAQALDPAPGSCVLDMCAAPGGKTTMIAQVMKDQGLVIALDRTQAKVEQIQSLAADWGFTCVQAYVADGTQLYQQRRQQDQLGEPAVSSSMDRQRTYDCDGGVSMSTEEETRLLGKAQTPAGSLPQQVLEIVKGGGFDAVLLDAPCSALGLRPRLHVVWTLPALEKLAGYQRALLHSAVHVLKPGGHLVYCTCTINPGENEANVRYVLNKWPQMQLVEQPSMIGRPGLVGHGLLSASEAALVQRFDPQSGEGDDTIGFFIAKFIKRHGI